MKEDNWASLKLAWASKTEEFIVCPSQQSGILPSFLAHGRMQMQSCHWAFGGTRMAFDHSLTLFSLIYSSKSTKRFTLT